MVYPYHTELQTTSQRMKQGNFGLWYNKLIPINSFEECEACGSNSRKDSAVELYMAKYSEFKSSSALKNLLAQRHLAQSTFCNSFLSAYEEIAFTAKLKTPLITGIGETHPHEISMVFDHNMGIPYIPASGIKGIVRFAHTLGLLDNIPDSELRDDNSFDDEKEWTYIPQLFGTQVARGSVIFLDAYPENPPDLHIDIMNPHYSDYYSDDKNRIPPADYLNPVPLKFLTVAKGTNFVFRALVAKNDDELVSKVKAAFISALTEEGVGAKTAVGYGRFEIIEDVSVLPSKINKAPNIVNALPVDKMLSTLQLIKSSETGRIIVNTDKLCPLFTEIVFRPEDIIWVVRA